MKRWRDITLLCAVLGAWSCKRESPPPNPQVTSATVTQTSSTPAPSPGPSVATPPPRPKCGEDFRDDLCGALDAIGKLLAAGESLACPKGTEGEGDPRVTLRPFRYEECRAQPDSLSCLQSFQVASDLDFESGAEFRAFVARGDACHPSSMASLGDSAWKGTNKDGREFGCYLATSKSNSGTFDPQQNVVLHLSCMLYPVAKGLTTDGGMDAGGADALPAHVDAEDAHVDLADAPADH